MLALPTLLGLVASVSAIDAYLGWDQSSSNKVHCPNLNPDTCCGADGQGFSFIEFREMPTSWDLGLRFHRGPRCGQIDRIEPSNGRVNVHANGGPWGGAGYGFNHKRSLAGGDEGEKDSVRPSSLIFGDGVHYDLTGLDDAAYDEMHRYCRRRRQLD